MMLPMTTASPQPRLDTSENPYNKAPNPKLDSIKDKISSFGLDVGKTSLTKNSDNSNTMTTTGKSIPNKVRQPELSITQPDKVGPIAGATPTAKPVKPMAVPRFSGGNKLSMMFCSSGIVIPTPNAWIKRPANNIGKLLAMNATKVPIPKIPIAPMYNHLVETLADK